MYDRIMRDRARELRNHPTEAEYRMWSFLRGKQFGGVKFRRQAPIGPYIVDFVAFEFRLIIELDGSQHGNQVEYDQQRTAWLESRRFRVLRFWNQDVFQETESVLEVITRTLAAIDAERKKLPPTA